MQLSGSSLKCENAPEMKILFVLLLFYSISIYVKYIYIHTDIYIYITELKHDTTNLVYCIVNK